VSFETISENLLRFEDICNVYVIKRGVEALLIDFGSGHVLDHLPEIGVEKVDAILHTHHHRDQAQGDKEAAKTSIPIYVPQHERHLFDQAEIYWTNKQIYNMYNVRNTYFSLTESVPVSGVLEDYGRFEWKGLEIEVLPTPGHTGGSVTLIARIDGARAAFIGDLIRSPGKVQTLYDLQYTYGALDGIEMTVLSLNLLEEEGPGLLCPSHGDPMGDVDLALSLTKNNLRGLYRLWSGGKLLTDEFDFTPVASRLLHATQTCSSFYVILSEDGRRAIFVDYGSPNIALLQPFAAHFEPGERVRFIRHSLSRLKHQYGVQAIEAVIPSHYHDDHINGIPYLQNHFGTQVWAYENMKEILENPSGELIGCVMPDSIDVDRTFRDNESFSWEGIDFRVHFSPGHCDYHMSMFTEMDGKRIAFSGDNVWPPDFLPSLIYRNHVHRTSHQVTARLFREYRPDVLCSGHGLFTNIPPEGYDVLFENARKLTGLFDLLLPQDSGTLGLEPSWIKIYPYQMAGGPGEILSLEVRVKNPLPKASRVEIGWAVPTEWKAEPSTETVDLEENGGKTIACRIAIPATYRFSHPKRAIAVEVSLNGRRLGQIAEAMVEYQPYGPAGAIRPKKPKK
jgi:glyoxylase-like metal-dependent hydrolase (beta-lactamase superfamily II)